MIIKNKPLESLVYKNFYMVVSGSLGLRREHCYKKLEETGAFFMR